MNRERLHEIVGPAPDGTVGFLHLDMDAFYVSIEILKHPELRESPVVVGGIGCRSVVAAANYEARVYGIHSAMPLTQAKRLCPHLISLPGDFQLYSEVSKRIMTILRDITPLVEPLSLDEAFCDVRGVDRSLLGPLTVFAAELRDEVFAKEQLNCSIGIASSKLLAKMATEQAKPKVTTKGVLVGSGVHVVHAGDESSFLNPLPVRALLGVGPATARKIVRTGVRTIGELAALPEHVAIDVLGPRLGLHLRRLARGIDDSPVVTHRLPRSFSHEATFTRDLHTRAEMDVEIMRLTDLVARRLRKRGKTARSVTLKVRYGDFVTITKSTTLPNPINGSREMAAVALGLLDHADATRGVRLLGIVATNLDSAEGSQAEQLSFGFENTSPRKNSSSRSSSSRRGDRWKSVESAMDRIRDRFGSSAVVSAAHTIADKADNDS